MFRYVLRYITIDYHLQVYTKRQWARIGIFVLDVQKENDDKKIIFIATADL